MRVLVTGASGFLGYHLIEYFRKTAGPGVEVVGTYHRTKPDLPDVHLVPVDLRGEKDCEDLLAGLSPTHFVHTAALSQTGDCEQSPYEAFATNVLATRNLVHACQLLPAKPYLLSLSSDLVFDGATGNYHEADEARPLQVYGTTKLQSEQETSEYCGPSAVLRSSLIYGAATPHRRCFLQWMVNGIREGRGSLFADEIRNPVWVEDLCGAIRQMCIRQTVGLFHCAGAERLSRWDFGRVVADVYGLELPKELRSTRAAHGLNGVRPADVTLNTERLQAEIGYSPTPLRQALQHVKNSD